MFDIGIMQGRLSPPLSGKIQSFPKDSWREEFSKARSVGLSNIEWIFEQDEWEKNPLSTDNGVKEILEIVRGSGVCVVSVCADYFLDIPYLRAVDSVRKDLREKLEWLVVQSQRIGTKFIDLPFVDASAISDRAEFSSIREFVLPALKRAETLGVTIALETSLKPQDFRDLLLLFDHPNLMANYDTGNSTSLGYNCVEELSMYRRWIRTVHIKDRTFEGPTVPLGTGNADFPSFFHHLSEWDYEGTFILQAAREGDEIETAKKNKKFVEGFLAGKSD